MYRQAPPVDWFWGRFGDQKNTSVPVARQEMKDTIQRRALEDTALSFKKNLNVKSDFGNIMGSSTLFVCILAL